MCGRGHQSCSITQGPPGWLSMGQHCHSCGRVFPCCALAQWQYAAVLSWWLWQWHQQWFGELQALLLSGCLLG